MQNFIKTLISAIQAWTKKEIKKTEDRIVDSTADWNENDSSKDSYIKNRTHWEEVKQKYLIPETSVFISEDYGNVSLSDSLPLLTIGQEYIVVLNGTTYKCIAREYDGSSAIIGNGTIYGDDNEGNGEPFSCDSYDDGSIYLNVATAGKYTISISIAQTEIHKLNPKYLDIPDNLATTDDIQEAMDLAQTAADTKMDKSNPVGTGSFSMGRKLNSYIGEKTFVFGTSLNAPNSNMHVIGNYNNTNIKYNLQSNSTSTTGYDKYKVVKYSMKCKINNDLSISLLQPILQAEQVKLPQGCYTFFNDNTSNTYVYFIENVVDGKNSAVITRSLLVVAEDNTACGDYIHIAGNGTSDTARSNAHTLDWNGVGWFQGGLQVGGNAQDDGAKNVLVEGDAISVPSTAQVGQLLSVKAIDENGKPTEWEAADAVKTVNGIAPDEDGNVEVANLPSSAVSYEEQELTDEQKAQARANIGAVDFQSMTVRPLPILKRDHIKTQYREYYVTTVDIFELEKYVNYVNEPTVDGLDNTAKFVIVCDDGTEKMVATMQFGFVYSLTSKANIYSYLYFENQIIRVTSSDISTANNIEIVTSNTSVSNQINLHDTNETAHSDIRTVISGVSSLVGDVSVSEQVNTALDNYNADWDAVNGEPGHILNKPFGEEIILSDSPVVFNGDISNKEKIMIATNTYFVKVSESYVDTATMIGSELTIYAGAYENTDVLTQDLVLDGNVVFGAEGAVVVFDNTPCVLSLPKDSTVQYSGVTFEVSKGTWFFYDSNTTDISYIKSLSCLYDKQEIIKKLDSKYLPDTVPLLEGKMTKVNPYFEGNIEGYTFLTFDGSNEEDGIGGLVKITDYILTEEECLGATVTASFEGVTFNDAITKKGDFTDVVGLPCDAYYADGSSTPYVVVIKSSGIGSGNIEGVEVSAGTYYIYMDTSGMDGGKLFIGHFSALDNKEVVEEKINPKYLPNEVALKSDIPSIEGLASEEYVNDLINAALSAIPNAAEVAY